MHKRKRLTVFALLIVGLYFFNSEISCILANALGLPPSLCSIAENPFRYSTYYHDKESSMYYLKARYYSPKLMRFISRDTYDLTNRYNYCDGDPVSKIDSDGHLPDFLNSNIFSISLAGAALAGALASPALWGVLGTGPFPSSACAAGLMAVISGGTQVGAMFSSGENAGELNCISLACGLSALPLDVYSGYRAVVPPWGRGKTLHFIDVDDTLITSSVNSLSRYEYKASVASAHIPSRVLNSKDSCIFTYGASVKASDNVENGGVLNLGARQKAVEANFPELSKRECFHTSGEGNCGADNNKSKFAFISERSNLDCYDNIVLWDDNCSKHAFDLTIKTSNALAAMRQDVYFAHVQENGVALSKFSKADKVFLSSW